MAEGRLNGKNAVITGGGSGMGQATAHRFVKEGASHIFLVDRRADRLEKVQKEIVELGGRASTIQAELSLAEDCARVIETAKKADGRIDILVSNAAVWTSEPFLEMKKESWDRVLAVNLTAAFLLGQGAARVMKDHGGGVILYTASISSLGASVDFTHYGVSKAGIVNLVQNMAIELAPYKIRVNCISPGPTDTQQSLDIVGAETMEKFRQDFSVVPLGRRMGRPEEMAAAFAFLASEDASYITGHNLVIDGGLTAHAYSIPEPN
jgi:NAD(P)-dependent dehydrogenase (short-subunit alcohol dehydrogenase family)